MISGLATILSEAMPLVSRITVTCANLADYKQIFLAQWFEYEQAKWTKRIKAISEEANFSFAFLVNGYELKMVVKARVPEH